MTAGSLLRLLLILLALSCLPVPAGAQPPALPGTAAASFFIDEGGNPSGPLTMDQLRQRVAAGTFTASTLAWTDGMPGWQPATQVPALTGLFQPMATATLGGPGTDPQRFLVGRWQVKGKLPMGDRGPTDGEIVMTYNPDGSFAMNGVYQVAHPQSGVIPVQMTMTGRWQVNGSNDPSTINLFMDGEMVMTIPPQFNIPAQTETMIQDEALQIVDAGTIRDTSGLTWRRL